MEIQTDPVKSPSPVQIVDLAREKELKSRIAELEHALEMKNDLIEKLHEQLPDKSGEDISMKKKDRSQSITGGGVFQNFVSQMKDKRDEANERSKKKEVERKAEKAAKDAARELIKERSPMRSKSPSLLTRLRDRSPVKTRSPVDNLETTPSSSSSEDIVCTEHLVRNAEDEKDNMGRSFFKYRLSKLWACFGFRLQLTAFNQKPSFPSC
ncbi:unnamed protein product [Cylicostephanus goldi]|uniref:Uncharacterized protein n=1 Tax=Cylicostephanus goldi TaxID=71465 RepID=A0A3P6QXP5_CYLGO|nr:unnamed protein product [Cylicostephanus goldi]